MLIKLKLAFTIIKYNFYTVCRRYRRLGKGGKVDVSKTGLLIGPRTRNNGLDGGGSERCMPVFINGSYRYKILIYSVPSILTLREGRKSW